MDIIFKIEECSNLLLQAGAGTIEFVDQPYHDLHVSLNDNIQLFKVLLQLLNGAEKPFNLSMPCLRRAAKRRLIKAIRDISPRLPWSTINAHPQRNASPGLKMFSYLYYQKSWHLLRCLEKRALRVYLYSSLSQNHTQDFLRFSYPSLTSNVQED